jgi:hypothetical protein
MTLRCDPSAEGHIELQILAPAAGVSRIAIYTLDSTTIGTLATSMGLPTGKLLSIEVCNHAQARWGWRSLKATLQLHIWSFSSGSFVKFHGVDGGTALVAGHGQPDIR